MIQIFQNPYRFFSLHSNSNIRIVYAIYRKKNNFIRQSNALTNEDNINWEYDIIKKKREREKNDEEWRRGAMASHSIEGGRK